jgi:pyruvate dehydrogenase E1 component beta subunit
MHTPGLKIAFPSNASDGYGLMRTAIRDDDVVVFCSHKLLMLSGEEVSPEPQPFGQAAVPREGGDITIVGVGYMANLALQAAETLASDGIAAEVIDPRTLEPFDLETVVRSVEKTRHLVVVDEDHLRCGAAGEICMMVLEAMAPGALAIPPRRVTAPQLPIPEGIVVEQALLPSVESIAAVAREVVGMSAPSPG